MRSSGSYGIPGGVGHQGGFGTPGTYGSPHGQTNPIHQNRFGSGHLNEEELRLRRNIELLGGIEKTIPSIVFILGYFAYKN